MDSQILLVRLQVEVVTVVPIMLRANNPSPCRAWLVGVIMSMDMKKMITRLAILVIAGLTSTAMANPVLISSAAGRYCYDFGHYVPSSDTPVIGGSMFMGASYYLYGKRCVNLPYGGYRDPANTTPIWQATHFYKDSRVPESGIYFSMVINQDTYMWTPAMFSTCPDNSASFDVPGYVRSDGLSDHPPMNYYSFGWGGWAVNNPVYWAAGATPGFVAVSGGYRLPSAKHTHNVCVKTDTTN